MEVKAPLGSLWEQGSAALFPAGRPQLGPSAPCRAWQGERDRKTDLGSSPSPAGAAEGLPRAVRQGEERRRSWELRSSELPGGEPGTSAPDGPARGRASRSSPSPAEPRASPGKLYFRGPTVVRSFLPHRPAFFWAGRSLAWGIALAPVCWGGSVPMNLAPALLPWTTLHKAAARGPSCLPVSPGLSQFVGAALGALDQSLAQLCRLCKQGASSCALAMLRPQGWVPRRGAGPGHGDSPWGLGCPCLPQQIPTPSPGKLGHLSPSSRSCWTEEPLCSLSGEVPGPSPSQ